MKIEMDRSTCVPNGHPDGVQSLKSYVETRYHIDEDSISIEKRFDLAKGNWIRNMIRAFCPIIRRSFIKEVNVICIPFEFEDPTRVDLGELFKFSFEFIIFFVPDAKDRMNDVVSPHKAGQRRKGKEYTAITSSRAKLTIRVAGSVNLIDAEVPDDSDGHLRSSRWSEIDQLLFVDSPEALAGERVLVKRLTHND